MSEDRPVTQKVLETVLQNALARQKEEITSELIEFVRQVETNLLTAFHACARGQQTRFHTVETIDNELRLRMNFLEDRILALETRHPLPPTPFPPSTR